jgi:hypothetical protein
MPVGCDRISDVEQVLYIISYKSKYNQWFLEWGNEVVSKSAKNGQKNVIYQ